MDSRPLKILAIDDHEDNLTILRVALRDALPQSAGLRRLGRPDRARTRPG